MTDKDYAPIYLSTAAKLPRLRIAVVLQDHMIGVPELRLVADLSAANFIDVSLISVLESPAALDTLGVGSRALLDLYRVVDRLINRRSRGDASNQQPLSFDGMSTLADSVDALLLQLKSKDLDVILCPRVFVGIDRLQASARYGVWWTGPTVTAATDQGYANYLLATTSANLPFTAVLWASVSQIDQPVLLEYGSARRVSGISVIKNFEPLTPIYRNLWLSALRFLFAQGWDALCCRYAGNLNAQRAVNEMQSMDTGFRSLGCTILQMAPSQVRRRRRLRKIKEQWRVGIRSRREAADAISDPQGYRWIQAPAGHWYADPFVFSRNGTETVFVEDFDEKRNLGHLACAEVRPDGSLSEARIVLHRPYHLSYPNVFEHDGEIFMIPETGFNNTVELYRAASYPDRWELVKVLFRGAAFDTNVFHEAGQFWFLTSLVEDAGRLSSQLLLFHAKTLDGDWTLHPASPISNDARIARGAGGIFRLGSSLIRPAQDCSQTYGGAVRFCRITRLNEREYAEEEFAVMRAEQLTDGVGLHTYNRSSNHEVIDCRLRLPAN